ncbi:hypothetical protein MLD38_014448 [Melastoma candidum]|uniref:Uncharacterized protein n=1 Tax=Melastoma candidum TaxID=119954 RepID=A0ACB9RCX7_9MYRT|nr:hypothetical protein MLD38_014448 [Melastoma candidum]
MWMPGLTGFKVPTTPPEALYYGESILNRCCQRKDQWLPTSVTGHMKHIADFAGADRRDWAPLPGHKTIAQKVDPQIAPGFWNGALTSRDLPVVFDNYLSFEVYNSQLCARQFGFIQSAAVPLADATGGLHGRATKIPCKSGDAKVLELLSRKAQLLRMEFPSSSSSCFATQFFTVLWSSMYEELRSLMHFLEVSDEPDFYPDDARLKARGSLLPRGPGKAKLKAPLAPGPSKPKPIDKGKAKVAGPKRTTRGDSSKANVASKRKEIEEEEEEDLDEMPLSKRRKLVRVPSPVAAPLPKSPTTVAATRSSGNVQRHCCFLERGQVVPLLLLAVQ